MLVIILAAILFAAILVLPVFLLPRGNAADSRPAPDAVSSPKAEATAETLDLNAYRAVWISYLEWEQTDFSSLKAFEKEAGQMFAQIAGLGATVAIVQVRSFGDAIYPSTLFPFSHLCTGTQGQDPGFDPLAILVEQAHANHLQIEAWINPYRLSAGAIPADFSADSLVKQHPDWVRQAADGLWLSPALTQVQDYIVAGVRELCRQYDLDGIHMDDYFYPTTETSFDEEEYKEYQQSGGTLTQAQWRRENVSALVRKCHAVTQEYGMRFGISPQGNLQNNLNVQYSDVARWLSEGGFVDYLMPQIYWGMQYESDGNRSMALPNCLSQWQALPRSESTQLYVGLGAYRIGDSDGSDSKASLEEWQSGRALADQCTFLAEQSISGVGLYRYDSLFRNASWPELARMECRALAQMWVD